MEGSGARPKHLREWGNYEKLCTVKTTLHLAALAAALLACCACKGADSTFECTGLVAQVSEWKPRKISILKPQEDGRHYALSSFWVRDPDSHPKVRSGDVVRIRAERAKPHGQMAPDMPDTLVNVVKEIEVTGQGKFPDGEPATVEEVVSGRRLLEFVRVRGTVSTAAYDGADPTWIRFTLRTPSGNAYAAVPKSEHTLNKLLALTDAEVEVRALVVAQIRWARFTGPVLLPIGGDSIRTVKPAPAVAPDFADDPRDVVAFARRQTNGDYVHKVRMTGLLLTETTNHVFMSISNGMIVKMAMQAKAKRLEPGTMATASGFVSYDYSGLVMNDAVLAPAPEAPKLALPESVEVKMWRAQSLARNVNNFTRRLVTISGRLACAPEMTYESGKLVLRDDTNYIDTDTYACKFNKHDKRIGLVMKVTGVCDPELEADSGTAALPKYKGMTVVALPGDGVVIEKPLSIWSMQNFAIVTIPLLVIIVIISITCIVQKILYDKRGRQLFAGRDHIAVIRMYYAVQCGDLIDQQVVGVGPGGLFYAHAGGSVSLRITVCQQNLFSQQRKRGAEIDTAGGFSYPAFLICKCNNLCHGRFPFYKLQRIIPVDSPKCNCFT